jgi:hypothetical protein
MQVDSEEEWFKGVHEYAHKAKDPTYPAFIGWLKGKSYPNFEVAREAFRVWALEVTE